MDDFQIKELNHYYMLKSMASGREFSPSAFCVHPELNYWYAQAAFMGGCENDCRKTPPT